MSTAITLEQKKYIKKQSELGLKSTVIARAVVVSVVASPDKKKNHWPLKEVVQ